MARRQTSMAAVVTPRSTAAGAEPGRLRSWAPAAVYGCYLAVAVVLTWRLWADPAGRAVAGNPQDASQFAWFLRFEATAISHGKLPALVTTAMNVPHGINMMWNTTVLLPGVLLTPVTLLAGPQASLTVLLTLGFAGSAASMFYVLRRYRASIVAAAVGGAVYGYSPALTHTAVGHYQLQFAVLPPLLVDAAVRLCLRPDRPVRAGAWLSLLVAAKLFIGEEMLFEAGLAAVLIIAVLALSRPREVRAAARQAVAGLATAAGLALLLASWGLWTQFGGPLTQHGSPFGADTYKNNLAAFITPSGFQLLHTSASARVEFYGGQAENVAYLGVTLIVVLLLAAATFWRQLPLRACAVTAAIMLLLSVGAHPITGHGRSETWVNLPWGWLEHLPVVSDLLPGRLSILADGAAAAVLAFAIDLAFARLRRTSLGRSWAAAVVAAVAVVAVLPLVPLPLRSSNVVPQPDGWTAALSALRLPPGARVLVVPVPTPELDDALRWQAAGGQQISLIGGYFEGPDSTGQAHITYGHVLPLSNYLDYLWTGTGPVPAPARGQVVAALRLWQPQAVLAGAASPRLLRYLEGIFGQPAIRAGSMLGWRMS